MSVVYTATRPGRTLCPRIQKLGQFLGIREEGKLVAMGGLRLHLAGLSRDYYRGHAAGP